MRLSGSKSFFFQSRFSGRREPMQWLHLNLESTLQAYLTFVVVFVQLGPIAYRTMSGNMHVQHFLQNMFRSRWCEPIS